MYAQQNIAKSTSIYNEEGKLQMIIAYSPSCNCRTYTEYFPDGKVFARRTFKVVDKKGEFIDGEDVTYFHNGSIQHYKLWKNAVPEGRAYSNYENGKLEHEEFYNNKYKTGTWRYFDKNGNLLREQLYDGRNNSWSSKKDDVTTRHYSGGKLLFTEVFKDGKLVKSDKKQEQVITIIPAKHNTDLVDGKKLFAMKCAVCHSIDKDGYGPALKDVTKRRNNIWLQQMIRNGMKLVESGDKDAVALYNRYNQKKHLNMEHLTSKQVQAIIDFLKKPD